MTSFRKGLLALAAALILRLHLTVPDAFLLQLTEPEEPDWVPPEERPSPPPMGWHTGFWAVPRSSGRSGLAPRARNLATASWFTREAMSA